MNNKTLCLHPQDNVGVALQDLSSGEIITLGEHEILLKESISAKHKFAVKNFSVADEIVMYGTVVGEATKAIGKGEAITLANIQHKIQKFSNSGANYHWEKPKSERYKGKTFLGYGRADGQVGTANYWLVFPLVFCENTNIKLLEDAFERALGFASPNPYENQIRAMVADYTSKESTLSNDNKTISTSPFPNLDGIRFLTHQGGCGGTRKDSDSLCGLLAGYVNHPNVAGATVLSLGCQNAQVETLKEKLNLIQKNSDKPLIICEQQNEGTTDSLIQKAIKETFEGLKLTNQHKRQPFPLSKLVLGLECGGSDGFSGISANPTLGEASDLVIAAGGAAILSEFPELCGAEQELINRCETKEIADKFIQLMKEYSDAAERVGSGFDKNPSPGNIKDGLLTDAIKSLGAAKKGGLAPISDVLDYTEYIQKAGLNLLCTPGNDVESTTGLAGSGANVILFSTGLGTPTGNPICPVIKVSSNHKVAHQMPDIIDFDAGAIISGEKNIEQTGDELLELIQAVASGEVITKADQKRNFDFIPWKRGVSL